MSLRRAAFSGLGLGKFSPLSLTVSSLAALALRAWYAFSSGAIVPSMLLSIYLGCDVLKCRDGGTVAVQLTKRVRHSANCLLLGWMDGRETDHVASDTLICCILSPDFLLSYSMHLRFLPAWPHLRNTVNDFAA